MTKSKKKSKKNSNIKYLSCFITRAFLISVICFMSIITFFVVIYFGDMLLNAKNGDYKNPLFGAYVIVSPSMVPTINVGDAIIIKRENNDDYNVGDIITFSSTNSVYEGLTITHRIVNKESTNNSDSIYTTKGDNNKLVDRTLVKAAAIQGKVLFKIPEVGKIQTFFNKPVNFLMTILVVSILFALYEFFRIFIMLYKKD